MAQKYDQVNRRVTLVRNGYNALFTVVWSVLCLYPVGVFSYSFLDPTTLYWFMGASALCFFLPGLVIDRLSLSKNVSVYKKLKMGWVNTLTQNGSFVNDRVKRSNSNYRVLRPREKDIKRLMAQTYMYEKFHLGLFVYFLLLTVYAGSGSQWLWAMGLLMANVIYNVLPMLLQQYIRLRLKNYLSDKRASQ